MANYNGHELPALPEWLRSKYPHAVISVTESANGTSYTLFALDQMGYWGAGAWYADGEFVETYQGLILSDVYDPAAGQVEQFATCQWAYDPAGDTWALRFSDRYETCIGIPGSFAEIGVTFRVIWSNTEILDANGDLYLAASPEPTETPEPVATALETWLSGYMVGLADGYRKKAAVAYLYNGVKLPPLPGWDRKKYPYVFIHQMFGLIYGVYTASAVEYTYNENGAWSIPAFMIATYNKYEDTAWKVVENPTESNPAVEGTSCLWSNFELLAEDGAVQLEPSEPVPVYE